MPDPLSSTDIKMLVSAYKAVINTRATGWIADRNLIASRLTKAGYSITGAVLPPKGGTVGIFETPK